MNRTRLEKILILAEQGMMDAKQTEEGIAFRRVYLASQTAYKRQTGHYFPRKRFRDQMTREVEDGWSVDIEEEQGHITTIGCQKKSNDLYKK